MLKSLSRTQPPLSPVGPFPQESSSSLSGEARVAAQPEPGCHRRLPGRWLLGCSSITQGLVCCMGKINPGSQARVWWKAEGLMVGLPAAKPCVKKQADRPGRPVPDPVAGIRDAEPFSPPSPAPAQPWLGSWCHVATGQGG